MCVTSIALTLLLGCLFKAVHSQELKYALFTSGPTGGFDSSGAVPAIELAEELINADSSILPGYNLTHTPVVDTMCDRTVSLNEYFDAISPPHPTVLGLLGCGCSVASTPVAEIIHHNSISQISYASSLTELSNRERFPNFFRTYPSDTIFTPAIVSLIREYGWKRIAFITQDERLFTETLTQVQDPLEEAGIEVANRMISSPLPITGLSANFFFEDKDYRVFFINTYSAIGKQIICEAYLRGYTYPKYAWLTYGWYQDRWWTEEVYPELTNCTDNQLAEFLHRSIALQLLPNLNELNATTDTGLTPRDFDSRYKRKLGTPQAQDNDTFIFLATIAYDAIWTLALALNRTNEMVGSLTREEILNMTQCGGTDEETGVEWEVVSLENFIYSNQLMGCIIRWNLERTNFVGISGQINFDNDGSRVVDIVEFFQYRLINNDLSILSREYFGFTQNINESQAEFFYKSGKSNITTFEGGVPPDGTPVPQFVTYHLALVIPYYILAVAGLIFCTVCLVFNFTQRKKRVVKITSPNINYFIIAGAYFNYIGIFFRVLPSTDYELNAIRCYADYLLNTIGYSLAFSAILVKMGRVYYIFHNPSLSKKTLNDWKLVLLVLSISSVGVLLSVLQISVPQLQPNPYPLSLTEDSQDKRRNEFGERINQMVYYCISDTIQTIYVAVTLVYLAILQIIGIILAIQTRKVKIKLLNDSKYIAAVIYISSISLVLIAIVTIVPGIYINLIEAIFSGSLLVATTFSLGLIFIPKMVSLYRDPEGEYVFNTAGNTLNTNEMNLNLVSGEVTTQMRERIVELENLLKDCQNGGKLTCPTCYPEDQPITIDANSSSAPADTGCSVTVIKTEQVEECTPC
ncbi:gamma-aminobutyric acid type B receptor subunit 2-like [Halichondria panicea]|uniref:gamma-aminobutyric acid type B receptor subunit 2-like n=1 Tax=Halichondria panicea TaxID=6063 RepID=UPI00312BA867